MGSSTTAGQPAIEVIDLTKTFAGGVEAVRSISFDVARGEVFGVLGPNGAGKSTTVGMLTTTVAPTSGCARLRGFDVTSEPVNARSVSAVVFQESVLDRPLSGRHNLTLHARLWGLSSADAQRRVSEVVDAFALGEFVDRPVETYSGGQRRRLEIARALLSEPEVLFLDEPTVGLDPRVRYELLDLIAGLRARSGMTILLTTHYLDEAEELCDRVAILHDGQIAALDSPSVLLAEIGREVLELRIDGDGQSLLRALQTRGVGPKGMFVVGSTVYVPLNGQSASEVTETVADLGFVTTATSTRRPTLDDVYLQLTGTSLAG
jgi:ABC-2 type transport system ATP-binding protein